MVGNPKVKSIDEKTMLQQVLLRKHGPLPLRSMLTSKTSMCRKHKRKIGYICTLRLPLTHPDQDFQGKRCDNKIHAERSAASECLRFIVDETELATTSTFDWKSHLNILLMQRLNQSDITGSDNINYQVVKLDENSVVLYMAKLTLPRLLPGLEYFGNLSRSKKQAEQSVAEKLASNPEAINRVLLACNDMNNIDGGFEAARRQANKSKKWSKYKGTSNTRGVKARSKHTGHPHSQHQHGKYQRNKLDLPDGPSAPLLPPMPKCMIIPPEGQSKYRYKEDHLQWKDLVASDNVPMPVQVLAYHTALRRNLIMVLPRGFGRTFIAGLLMHRMLLSTAFGSSNASKSSNAVGGMLERRVSYAVMVVADASTGYAQRDKLAADTGLRVFAVGSYSDAVAMCGQVLNNEFDLLVISGDLLLHHLQLGVCAALQVVNTCVIVFYDCIQHHFVPKIMHMVKCCPVKPRLLAVTADPAAILPHATSSSATSAAIKYAPSERQIAAQITTLQWVLMDSAVFMPVLPPPVIDIETVLLGKELPPTQPPLPPPMPTEKRPTPPLPSERPAPPPPLPPTVLPIGKVGLVKMALMDSIGCYSSDEDSDIDESTNRECAASNAVTDQGEEAEAFSTGDVNIGNGRVSESSLLTPTAPAAEPTEIVYYVVQDLLTAVSTQVTVLDSSPPPVREVTDPLETVQNENIAEMTPLQELTALLTEASDSRALGNILIYVDALPAARALQEGLQLAFPSLDCVVLNGAYEELQVEDLPPDASLAGQQGGSTAESVYYGDICIDSDEASTSDEFSGEIDIDDIFLHDGSVRGGDAAHIAEGEFDIDDIGSGGDIDAVASRVVTNAGGDDSTVNGNNDINIGDVDFNTGDNDNSDTVGTDVPVRFVGSLDTLLTVNAEEVAANTLVDIGDYCGDSDTENECGSDTSSVDLHLLYAYRRQQQHTLQVDASAVLDGHTRADLDEEPIREPDAGSIAAVDLEFLGIPKSFLGAAPWKATGDTLMEHLFANAPNKVVICTVSALCDGQLTGLAHVDLAFVIRLGGDTSYLHMIQNLCGLQKSAVHFAQKTRYVAILSGAERKQFELRQRTNAVVRKLFAMD